MNDRTVIEPLKKLIRNSQYILNTDNFKRISALVAILRVFRKRVLCGLEVSSVEMILRKELRRAIQAVHLYILYYSLQE